MKIVAKMLIYQRELVLADDDMGVVGAHKVKNSFRGRVRPVVVREAMTIMTIIQVQLSLNTHYPPSMDAISTLPSIYHFLCSPIQPLILTECNSPPDSRG